MAKLTLADLKKGERARIVRILTEESERFLIHGFVEGGEVQVQHFAPFGGDPIALRVRDSLIAIRLNEAVQVEVERL